MAPSSALACTWCAASAFGDRTFNWPYLSLILAPFAIAVAIGSVLAYYHRVPQTSESRRGTTVEREGDRGRPSGGREVPDPRAATRFATPLDKETT